MDETTEAATGAVPRPRPPVSAPSAPYPGPAADDARRRRTRRTRRLATVAVSGLAVAALLSALFTAGHPPRAAAVGATPVPTVAVRTPTPTPTPTPSFTEPALPPPPRPSGPPTVSLMLALQSYALLTGDRAAWLAPLAHADASTRTLYQRMFTNLRQLRIGQWTQRAREHAGRLSGRATVDVTIRYCVGARTCKPTEVTMRIVVRGGAGLPGIVSATVPRMYGRKALPWAVTTLYSIAGGRVVVLASGAEKSQLGDVIGAAVTAADTADEFAHWGRPPYYILYLASPAEFAAWFATTKQYSAIGRDYLLSAGDPEAVIEVPQARVGFGGWQVTVQHEFGHSATLYGIDAHSGYYTRHDDDVVEGIAELVSYTDVPAWDADRQAALRTYIKAGKWSGHVYLTKEVTSDDVATSNAAYTIGYLTMRWMSDTYGRAKMLDFFDRYEHRSATLDAAARAALGLSWPSVDARAKAYILKAIGA